jgi:hypothetical protein
MDISFFVSKNKGSGLHNLHNLHLVKNEDATLCFVKETKKVIVKFYEMFGLNQYSNGSPKAP